MDATFDQLARETGHPRPRKRGGQPGNQNALTHGFYSKTFRPAEDHDIDEIKQISLDSEIDMLRVSIRRIFDLTATVTNPIEAVRFVHVLTRAVTSLDHLVVRQHALHNTNTAVDSSLREALDILDDLKGERAADARKRFAIQKAIVLARLDAVVPPPPGTPPQPDPRTLPQPNPDYDEFDPFSRVYKRFEIAYSWEEAYGEESPLVKRFADYPVPASNAEIENYLGNYGTLAVRPGPAEITPQQAKVHVADGDQDEVDEEDDFDDEDDFVEGDDFVDDPGLTTEQIGRLLARAEEMNKNE
jgi:hypothetical protein